MAIIYEPSPKTVALQTALNQILKKVFLRAAVDFISRDNEPWSFYAGVGVGEGVVVASGFPGAAITLYVVGDVLDAAFLHSEDSSNVRVFLNGVAYSTFETYAAATAWELVQVVLQEGVNRIDFVNDGVGLQNVTGIPWFALSQLTVTGGAEALQEIPRTPMPSVISIQLAEAAAGGDVVTVPLYVPNNLTLAQYTAFADEAATRIGAASDLTVTGATLQLNIELTGPFAAADEDADGDIGVLVQMSTENARTYSTRIPGILNGRFAGKSLPRGADGTPVSDLVDLFEDGFDVGGGTIVKPTTPDGIALVALKGLTKSTRKL